MNKDFPIIKLALAGALMFGATQVNWDHVATGVGAGMGAKALLDKAGNAKVMPLVNPSKSDAAAKEGAKSSLAKDAAKTAVPVAGLAVIAGAEVYGIDKGAPVLERKLEKAQQDAYDKDLRNSYCVAMPQLKGTKGCP